MEQAFGEGMLEKTLSKVGAKVVKATENAFAAKKLCEEAHFLLMDVQMEVAGLYEHLAYLSAHPDHQNTGSQT